ncbi:stalk domain-containing protein [Paenibacillus sp. NPDC058174]|uniref:stalk domain-containing protein n=1 Tax=Paenibacillus sp. NPDC058174 TaxID=3346366 RepID=UPI0036D87486
MIKVTKSKMFILLAAMVLSLAFAGVAGAAAAMPKTIKKDGMELVHLRQAAEMYGYSVKWDGKENSVTLMYSGNMTDDKMDDGKMMNDKMMDDNMADDKMMSDTKMDTSMKPAGQSIKVWIGKKMITVDGKKVDLDAAAVLYHNNTYVSPALVTKYMKPASKM